MKSIRFNLSAWVRPVRLVIAAVACAFLVFSYATPAFSASKNNPPTGISGTQSKPSDGEANLLDIELKSQEAVLSKPYSLEETQKEASKGLNEIQGDSDIENMKRPENTQGVDSIEQKIEKALEAVTGKD
ncbi:MULTISPECIES: low temperature-induced protein [Cyanophyceae]|uniref:low temperature-induced protein n=1 Tax=Cyanophyceae TaxID=3028117 RepID=UPI00168400A1|nr:low temperature-induced protein [Trichocoleus sp. FACHB-69]MBD1933701.1 low temperature-induced protein [Trichocoleus sp. FACHB-69]